MVYMYVYIYIYIYIYIYVYKTALATKVTRKEQRNKCKRSALTEVGVPTARVELSGALEHRKGSTARTSAHGTMKRH